MLKAFLNQQHAVLTEENMSNFTSASGEASVSSGNPADQNGDVFQQSTFPAPNPPLPPLKKKRNLPGNPDPDAEVIALSPKSLMTTNRFVCEVCSKGFQRDQNLQLHRRGHNLPWKLRQRTSKEMRKRVYVCPEPACVHHHPSRALGDLTGIKKHYCRKHGEKKWKCEKCSKRYAVQSDWKAHSKTCGTREYRCDCGTLFSRRDSFITHRAFCDALAEESAKSIVAHSLDMSFPSSLSSTCLPNCPTEMYTNNLQAQIHSQYLIKSTANKTSDLHGLPSKSNPQLLQYFNNMRSSLPPWPSYAPPMEACPNPPEALPPSVLFPTGPSSSSTSGHRESFSSPQDNDASIPSMSATALLQKATQIGASMSRFPCSSSPMLGPHQGHMSASNGFGLGFSSSREDQFMESSFVHEPAAFGDKAAILMDQTATTAPSLLQSVMMDSVSSAAAAADLEESYQDETFGGLLGSSNERKSGGFTIGSNHCSDQTYRSGISNSERESGDGNDGFTRDFLGLRDFSASDMILSMAAGFSPCLNQPTSSYDHQGTMQNQKTWQG